MADMLDEFLFRLTDHVPDLPLETRLSIERDMRGHYGGSRVGDVAKGIDGLSKTTRTLIVKLGLVHQKPIRDLHKATGVSRATFFRYLGSK